MSPFLRAVERGLLAQREAWLAAVHSIDALADKPLPRATAAELAERHGVSERSIHRLLKRAKATPSATQEAP